MAKQKGSYERRLFFYLKNRFSPSLELFEADVWEQAIKDFESDEKAANERDKVAQKLGHEDHDAYLKHEADVAAQSVTDSEGNPVYNDAADKRKKDAISHTNGFENYSQMREAEIAKRKEDEKNAL